jgi:hypothetical protein
VSIYKLGYKKVISNKFGENFYPIQFRVNCNRDCKISIPVEIEIRVGALILVFRKWACLAQNKILPGPNAINGYAIVVGL